MSKKHSSLGLNVQTLYFVRNFLLNFARIIKNHFFSFVFFFLDFYRFDVYDVMTSKSVDFDRIFVKIIVNFLRHWGDNYTGHPPCQILEGIYPPSSGSTPTVTIL